MKKGAATFNADELVSVVGEPRTYRCLDCPCEVFIERCSGRAPFCTRCQRHMAPVNQPSPHRA